ncbi:MAG: SpoIID/LytB domain-containing protein [Clostridia bacterium]
MKKSGWVGMICAAALLLQGCASSAEGNAAVEATENPTAPPPQEQAELKVDANAVAWPKEKLTLAENGVPSLRVYVVDDGKVETVDVESYVEGVLAGEMKNDWPLEALKAQAILARTFVLKFLEEKESKYPEADISTDIEEAQAYDKSAINERIQQAVAQTKGQVLSAGGKLPYAWFHAHSGSVTEKAIPGLGWNKAEPVYTLVTQGNEPENVENEKDAKELKDAQRWEATFSAEEFAAACAKQGVEVSVGDGATLAVAERGESGRVMLLDVDGERVKAAELRIALGSTKMRSTLLTSLRTEGGKVLMAGTGYGHGVGMSQWGAYGMAEQGKTAHEIATHYFKDVQVVRIW